MQWLMMFSRGVDGLNERVGAFVKWLVFVAVFVCSINATVRYAFNYSSNGFLEVQWYLFSVVFLLFAGLTLKRNQHVRIDILSGRLSPRGAAWLDIFGTVVFLMPMALIILYYSWNVFALAWVSKEMSSDPGGLIRWPVKIMIPIGFFLLVLQGLSEIIKRVAFLRGLIPDPTPKNSIDDTSELEAVIQSHAQKKAQST